MDFSATVKLDDKGRHHVLVTLTDAAGRLERLETWTKSQRQALSQATTWLTELDKVYSNGVQSLSASQAELAHAKAEADRWWKVLCEASDELGGPTPEKAPHIPGWIRKLNARVAELEEENEKLRQGVVSDAPQHKQVGPHVEVQGYRVFVVGDSVTEWPTADGWIGVKMVARAERIVGGGCSWAYCTAGGELVVDGSYPGGALPVGVVAALLKIYGAGQP